MVACTCYIHDCRRYPYLALAALSRRLLPGLARNPVRELAWRWSRKPTAALVFALEPGLLRIALRGCCSTRDAETRMFLGVAGHPLAIDCLSARL